MHEEWCEILDIDIDACKYANHLVDGGMICIKPIEIFGIKMPDYGYIREECWNPFQATDVSILLQFKSYVESISKYVDVHKYREFLRALALHAIMDLIEHQGNWWGYNREGFKAICERLMNKFKAIQFYEFSTTIAEVRDELKGHQLVNDLIKDILKEKGVRLRAGTSPRDIQSLFSELSLSMRDRGLGGIFIVINGWGPVPAGAPAIRKIHSILSKGICIHLKILVGTYRWNYSSLDILHEGYYCNLNMLREDLEKLAERLTKSH